MVRRAVASYHRRMQDAAILPSSNHPAGAGRRRHLHGSAAACLVAACEIPASFTPDQANWIRALHRLHRLDPPLALQQLAQGPRHMYSPAQLACIEELLKLGPKDFCATLADATERRSASCS